MSGTDDKFNRRSFNRLVFGTAVATGAGVLGHGVAMAQAVTPPNGADTGLIPDAAVGNKLERRISGFRAHEWQTYFSNLRNGAVLVDVNARSLHFWPSDDSAYKIYPVSVPLTEEMTRRGRTSVVQKRVGPDWRPTPSMLRRNPDLPRYVGPGPENPLGTHALYLGWEYYRIHGTNDTRKIGRQSSNGCIGLYNEHIVELFAATSVGTQVLVI